MQSKTQLRVLVASVLIAMSPLASGQTTPPPTTTPIDTEVKTLDTVSANKGQTQVATKIASNFTKLAGSPENALKLVQGLRNGTAVTLTSTTTTTPTTGTGTGTSTGTSTTPTTTESTITPATGKMGWGNVKIALALAQDSLARAGITNPTSAQLNAALNGGDITVKAADGTTSTVTLKGVLQMRADGMGWGQIAQAGGTKVGPVVSQLKMSQKQVAALPTDGKGGSTTTTTATGTTSTAKATTAKGVTTAAGTPTTAGASSNKGITTATGVTSTGSGSRGLVTAGGVGAGQSAQGNAYGRGVVTAAGGGATNSAATLHGKPSGAGVVTATGSTASSVTTASGNGGNGGGNGKGNGGGNGGGKKN